MRARDPHHRLHILTLCLLLTPTVVFAQLLGTASGTMAFPSSLPSGQTKMAVGVTFMTPPPDVVEEFASVLRAPLFEFQALYGLPYNVLLEGRATTIFVSNHLSLGAKYIVPATPFGFSAGIDLAYWFGKLDIDGFDNRVKGWNLYPSVAAGYDFGRFAVTVKGELNFILTKSQRVGEIVITKDENVFNGGAFSVFIEQPLWKDNYVTIGLKNNFVKFYYAVWPGFPTFERFSYVPEFYIGFRL